MKIITCLSILLFHGVSMFPAQMQDATADSPAILVPDTQMIDLTSMTNGDEYRIMVALPASYASSEQTYPVLYVLDPLITFLLMTELIRFLSGWRAPGVNRCRNRLPDKRSDGSDSPTWPGLLRF